MKMKPTEIKERLLEIDHLVAANTHALGLRINHMDDNINPEILTMLEDLLKIERKIHNAIDDEIKKKRGEVHYTLVAIFNNGRIKELRTYVDRKPTVSACISEMSCLLSDDTIDTINHLDLHEQVSGTTRDVDRIATFNDDYENE